MVQTLTLLSLGALTSPWNPPGSCLSTTTLWGDSLFLGYHRDAGLDPQCVPNVAATPTVSVVTTNGPTPSTYTATIIPSPTITGIAQLVPSAGQNISAVAYYSPGVCPSGFVYAASFTAGLPEAGKESRYICCPSGFRAQNTTSTKVSRNAKGGHRTIRRVLYEYPLCTQTTRTVSNLWSLTPGWPSKRPSTFVLTSTQTSDRYSKSFISVTASGVVVAWDATDTPVVDYIRRNNIQLPALPPTSKKNISPGAIVGMVIGGIFFLVFLFFFFLMWRGRRARNYKEVSKDELTEPLTGTATAYAGAGPSTELSTLHVPGATEPRQSTSSVPGGAPPRYDDAVVPQKP